ncbi:MAG: cytochrome c oxidase accessory protein CcoG [Saprospiraceae bacterium]|jgi:cytochrome c oxidase accessory protein FixG
MNELPIIDNEEFRDSIATVDEKGGRVWIYPKKPSGKFYTWRIYLSWILLALLFGMPFLKVNGEPFLLFNIIERKFILFSIVFTPQDMHLFALAMLTLMVFIVLFTVVFGRLFCGWVCPQTIFMEMVFRRIEYWIEGDANQQRKLNKGLWTSKKFGQKLLKHSIFFAIAVLIANTFLAYIIGIDEVKRIISEPVNAHIIGFSTMLIFSAVFYSVFAFFREQVCVVVCPYGRLQGVLLIQQSIVVIYDWIRGEPRGKIRKSQQESESQQDLGDCIDCKLCVHVCPTGIDIRHGTQLECVNCTACMDACDEVMEKINRPAGLIRYDSHSNIEKGVSKILNARVWAYGAVLIILILFQSYLFNTRSDVESLLLRTPGMLYQEVDNNKISNLYNYQFVNKTNETIEDVELKLVGIEGDIKIVGSIPDVPKMEMVKGALFIEIDRDLLKGRKNKLKLEVYSKGIKIDQLSTNFLGPVK